MRVDLKFDENIIYIVKKNNDLIKLEEFLGGFIKDLFAIVEGIEYTFGMHGKKNYYILSHSLYSLLH